ncbi:MAG: response regulator [Ruminiclostridium sp.]|nr:response regulator [Ruminiclostridium sp.]
MKRKVLLNYGENMALLRDFFQYTSKQFFTVSTTSDFRDVLNHVEAFKPDVYIIFMDNPYSDMITQIPKLRESPVYNKCPIVVVGKTEDCKDLENNNRAVADFMVRRPISADNLALSIENFLDSGTEEQVNGDTKKRILVVDDDRLMLKTIKSALEDKYEVTAMLNGVMVEKFLSQNMVDLIILDYEMPIMTGAEVFRRIRSNAAYNRIPICFLTGVSDRAKVEEIMALKPRGYLLKPINMEMLLATVANLA